MNLLCFSLENRSSGAIDEPNLSSTSAKRIGAFWAFAGVPITDFCKLEAPNTLLWSVDCPDRSPLIVRPRRVDLPKLPFPSGVEMRNKVSFLLPSLDSSPKCSYIFFRWASQLMSTFSSRKASKLRCARSTPSEIILRVDCCCRWSTKRLVSGSHSAGNCRLGAIAGWLFKASRSRRVVPGLTPDAARR